MQSSRSNDTYLLARFSALFFAPCFSRWVTLLPKNHKRASARLLAPVLTIALAITLLTACGKPTAHSSPSSHSSPSLTPLTLALNWFPEMEHGGYYAAQLNNAYTSAGLDVTITPGGPGTPVIPQLAAGRTDFAIANADDLITARARGIPVVAIFAPIQHSPRCIIVHESSGITTLTQLANLTLSMNASNAFAVFLQKKFPLPGVRIVPYQGSTAQFRLNPKFAQQGYTFSEPYIIQTKGGDPHPLLLADAGFNPYTSLLVTTEQMLSTHPDLPRSIAHASAQGWSDYITNPTPTNSHIHSLNPQLPLDVLAYGAKTLTPLVQTSTTLGTMTPQRWTDLINQMESINLIQPNTVQATDCFKQL